MDKPNIPIYPCWINNFERLQEMLKSHSLYITGIAHPGMLGQSNSCDVYMSSKPASHSLEYLGNRIAMMTLSDCHGTSFWKRWCMSAEVAAMLTMLSALGYEIYLGFDVYCHDRQEDRRAAKPGIQYFSYTESLTDAMYPNGRMSDPAIVPEGVAWREMPVREVPTEPPMPSIMKTFDPNALRWP